MVVFLPFQYKFFFLALVKKKRFSDRVAVTKGRFADQNATNWLTKISFIYPTLVCTHTFKLLTRVHLQYPSILLLHRKAE